MRKAIATGRNVAGEDGTIDPVVADSQWASSTDLSKPLNSVIGVPKKRRKAGSTSDPLGLYGSGAADGLNGPPAGDTSRLVTSYAARSACEA